MSGLMQGKRGLIMGVANDFSLAWHIAQAAHAAGAELAFTYALPQLERRVMPLADAPVTNAAVAASEDGLASVEP